MKKLGFPSNRTNGDRPPFRGAAGVSLVELVVVLAIVAVLSTWIGIGYWKASRQESNFRREAFVRTELVRNLERLSRGISLADGTSDPARFEFGYPVEVGGVSFETNRLLHVLGSSLALEGEPGRIRISVDGQAFVKGYTNRILSAEAPSSLSPNPVGNRDEGLLPKPGISEFSVKPWFGSSNLVEVSLASPVAWRRSDGSWTERTVRVDRIVRMWNR